MYSTDLCDIKRETCHILFSVKKEWWDTACDECEKTRVETAPDISPWTRRALELKFEIEDCGIPYVVDDLSSTEWHVLGTLNREFKAIEAEQRKKEAAKWEKIRK